MRKKSPKNLNKLKRNKNFRPTRKKFLIVCEGEKTEPNYFLKFRVNQKLIEVVGVGANTVSLVEKTIELKDDPYASYDQVWCVFDRDSFPARNFNAALALANKSGIEVAYSNEAFEIWYLLHFYYHTSATSRAEYARMLTERLGVPYKKNDPSMYEKLLDRQETAIRNAGALLQSHIDHSPERDNPSTIVHVLVQELNKHSV